MIKKDPYQPPAELPEVSDARTFDPEPIAGASLGQVIKMARSQELSGKGLAGSSFENLVQEAHSKSQTAPEQLGDKDSPSGESSRAAVPDL